MVAKAPTEHELRRQQQRRDARYNRTVRQANAKNADYDNMRKPPDGGNSARQARLAGMRDAQRRGQAPNVGNTATRPKPKTTKASTGGTTSKPAGVVESAKAGAQAAKDSAGKTARTPHQVLSSGVRSAKDGIDKAANNEQVKRGRRFVGRVADAGKNTMRRAYNVGRGGVRIGAGALRMATNPVTLGALGASTIYGAGREDIDQREGELATAGTDLGATAPHPTQILPSPEDASLPEKFTTFVDTIGSGFSRTAENIGHQFSGAGLPRITRDMKPEQIQAEYDRATQVRAERRDTPLYFTGDDQVDEGIRAAEDRLTNIRGYVDNAGDAIAVDQGIRDMQSRIVSQNYVPALASPNLMPEQRSAIFADIAQQANLAGIRGQALVDVLNDSGLNPELSQAIAVQATRQTPLVGYDNEGNAVGTIEGDNFLRWREGPLPGSQSTGRIRQMNDNLMSFTDLNVPYSEEVGENGIIRPELTDEQQAANERARQRVLEGTPEWGGMGDLEGRAMSTMGRYSSAIPGMSGADLAALPLRERLGKIMDLRQQARNRIDEETSTPGWRRRVAQRADPTGQLRRTSKLYAKRQGGAYEQALREADAAMRTELENRYMPQVPKGMEDATLEQEGRAAAKVGEGYVADFHDAVANRAGDNVDARRNIESLARTTGVEDLVRTGQMTSQQAEMEVGQLYAVDQMIQKFSKYTGKTVGADVEGAYESSGMQGVRDLLRSHFIENGGDYEFDEASFRGILDSSERGALWENMKSAVTAGLFGDDGINTMMLRGPEGERISVGELIGDDPYMYQMFISLIRDAAEEG